MILKNNGLSPIINQEIEEGFFILTYENFTETNLKIYRNVDSNLIQFHFCYKGDSVLYFNNGSYSLANSEDNVLLLYNPRRELPMEIALAPDTQTITVLISIKKLHSLISQEAEQISFLSDENIDKKYYKENVITASMAVVLSQILKYQKDSSLSMLYLKGKAYELLSLYFIPSEASNLSECPFLVDEDNVRRIRNAKQILLSNISHPPTLFQLANEVGISVKKLKEGFKKLYGSTVYQFVMTNKMDYARKLLGTGSYNVNEVALKLGYSNSSHFIEAFKKKIGTTAKKYLLSVT